jgi:hypothetical protein
MNNLILKEDNMRNFRFAKLISLGPFLFAVLMLFCYAQEETECPRKVVESKKPDLTYKITLSLSGPKITNINICTIDKENLTQTLENARSRFAKNALIQLAIFEKRGDNYCLPDENNYLIDISPEDVIIRPLKVYTGTVQAKVYDIRLTEGEIPSFKINVPLDEEGQKYSIKVTRYDSLDEKLIGNKGKVVFETSVKTFSRFFWGLNAGVFAPINSRDKSYSLFYDDPSNTSEDARPIIKEQKSWKPRAIVFLSYYPGGFEPDRKGNFQINLGTEISSSILENIYLGVGYATKAISFNVFVGSCIAEELPNNYSKLINQQIPNKNIDNLPLIKKRQAIIFGLSIAVPISIAGIFGKLIAL